MRIRRSDPEHDERPDERPEPVWSAVPVWGEVRISAPKAAELSHRDHPVSAA